MRIIRNKALVASITAGVLLLTGGSLASLYADQLGSNQAGTAEDPIVTKSYVDFQVQSKVQEEFAKQTVNTDEINQIIDNFKKELESQSKSSSELTVVNIPKGRILYAGAGSEFVVRSGQAIAYSNDGNGIPDLTAGKDIPNGSEITNNHLLLFPREGRGIKPSTDGGLIVMVRGSYLLMDDVSEASVETSQTP